MRVLFVLIFLVPATSKGMTFDYSGVVTSVGGTAFVSVGYSLEGFFEFDFNGAPETWSDPQNVVSVQLIFSDFAGTPGFCHSFNEICPPPGGVEFPIVSVGSLSANASTQNAPILDSLELSLFNATFNISAVLVFDFTNQNSLLEYENFPGLVSGDGTITAVPLPATIW